MTVVGTEKMVVYDYITENKIAISDNGIDRMYVIRTKKRYELQKYLNEHGISTGMHYPTALPFLKAYHYMKHRPEDFPIAHKYQNEILSLPLYPELSAEQIHFVCRLIQNCI